LKKVTTVVLPDKKNICLSVHLIEKKWHPPVKSKGKTSGCHNWTEW